MEITSRLMPGKIFQVLMKDDGVLEEIKLLVLSQWLEHHGKRHTEITGQGEEQ